MWSKVQICASVLSLPSSSSPLHVQAASPPKQRTGCSGSSSDATTSSSDPCRTSLIQSRWSLKFPSHSWLKWWVWHMNPHSPALVHQLQRLLKSCSRRRRPLWYSPERYSCLPANTFCRFIVFPAKALWRLLDMKFLKATLWKCWLKLHFESNEKCNYKRKRVSFCLSKMKTNMSQGCCLYTFKVTF